MAIWSTDKCTGGTASASSVYLSEAQYNADKAFDDNESTYWHANEGVPAWIKYDFGVSVTWDIEKLRIYPRFNAGHAYCNAFTLHGSNDDSDWDLLLSDTAADTDAWKDYIFSNSTAYRYYKLTATSSHIGTWVSFYEIE
ncbi:unnamed protein product, partial [marine sediment metagenome]